MKDGDDLNAHAWVQLGDWIVNDHSGALAAYEPLSRWSDERGRGPILVQSQRPVEQELSIATVRDTRPERLDTSP